MGFCCAGGMSGSLMTLVCAWVAKSTTANALSLPFWAYTLSVEPSGCLVTAIGEGPRLIVSVQATSLVRVSITNIAFAGGLAALTAPATTYLPSGVTFRSWMPPLIGMVLAFVSEIVSITSSPPLALALITGNSDRSLQSWAIAT